jgi:hypothetical protein
MIPNDLFQIDSSVDAAIVHRNGRQAAQRTAF